MIQVGIQRLIDWHTKRQLVPFLICKIARLRIFAISKIAGKGSIVGAIDSAEILIILLKK